MKVLYTVYKKYKRNRHGSGEPWLLFWVLSRSVDTLGSLPNFLAHRDENHRQDDGENCNPHTHLTHLRSNDENHHHHEGDSGYYRHTDIQEEKIFQLIDSLLAGAFAHRHYSS